jgi:hypothetical protein
MFPVPEFAVVPRMTGPTAIGALGRPPMMAASVSAGTGMTADSMVMMPAMVSARSILASGVMAARVSTPTVGRRMSDGGGQRND